MITDSLASIEAAIAKLDELTHHQPSGQAGKAQQAFAEVKEIVNALLVACVAQHEAIDMLFAMLIARDRLGDPHPFRPSQSGHPWAALAKGNAAIAKAMGRAPDPLP
jgi:hypothetical protein